MTATDGESAVFSTSALWLSLAPSMIKLDIVNLILEPFNPLVDSEQSSMRLFIGISYCLYWKLKIIIKVFVLKIKFFQH